MAEKVQMNAQQRANYFSTLTRNGLLQLPSKQATSGEITMQWELPKSKLLAKLYLMVTVTVNAKGTAGDIKLGKLDAYKVFRRISLDLNNSFMPYSLSGESLAILNMVRLNPNVVYGDDSANRLCDLPLGSKLSKSTAGVDNIMSFMVELPVMINQRDPICLVSLQNTVTQVVLNVDLAKTNCDDFMPKDSGTTYELKKVDIAPCMEVFSYPSDVNAWPDISTIKLCHSKTESFGGGGVNTIALPVGTTYRKLLFSIKDDNGVPLKPADITGDFEIYLNASDLPYKVRPDILRFKNISDLGYPLPDGVYLFDFSNQGIPNLGGTRDYISTESLAMLEFKFSTTKAGKIETITERLTRLT